MNKIYILSLFTVLVLFSGCIADDNNSDTKDIFAVESYMPSSLSNMEYVWKAVTHVDDTGSPDSLTYTETITGPVRSDGNDIYTRQSSKSSDSVTFYIDSDSIFFIIEPNMFPVLGNNSQTPFGGGYLFFNFDIAQGVSYTILDWGTEIEDFYINYYIKGELLGNDNITTPSGSEYDCKQFRIRYDTVYTPKVTGDTSNFSRIETHWFAKGAGPVKRVIEVFNGAELIETTYEDVLEIRHPAQ